MSRCGLWKSLVEQLSLSAVSVITGHCAAIVPDIISAVSSQHYSARLAVTSMIKLGGTECLKVIVKELVCVLDDENVIGASKEDVEIMSTPPTQLWHQGLYQQ